MANLSYGTSGSSYYDLSRQKRVFSSAVSVAAVNAYTTTTGMSGPLLWNPGSSAINAVILGISVSDVAAQSAVITLGLTGSSGQSGAPTTTTAATVTGNMFIGGAAPACTVYQVGTVAVAGSFFFPLGTIYTGAVTVSTFNNNYFDVAGAVVAPPGSWVSVASFAGNSGTGVRLGVLWAEIPL